MAKEVERKFLVRANTWRSQDGGKGYRQDISALSKSVLFAYEPQGIRGSSLSRE